MQPAYFHWGPLVIISIRCTAFVLGNFKICTVTYTRSNYLKLLYLFMEKLENFNYLFIYLLRKRYINTEKAYMNGLTIFILTEYKIIQK